MPRLVPCPGARLAMVEQHGERYRQVLLLLQQ
jgi:hypothetical protein